MTPPKGKKPADSGGKKGRSKKTKEPTQRNPKGTRVKIIGPTGKARWEWQ